MELITHTFKLTSGVECEVRELTGKEQRLLTEGRKDHRDRLTSMLASCIVRVGSNTDIKYDDVEDFLSSDKKKALTEVRQFTMDFDRTFVFRFKHESDTGEKTETEIEELLSEDGRFPSKPVMIDNPEYDIEKSGPDIPALIPVSYKEYSEILRIRKVTLPRTGTLVRYNLLDVKGEKVGTSTKKNDRSSHTSIMMRRPVYFHKKEGGKESVPVRLDLDRLPLKDIEFLRNDIRKYEGQVDTELMFDHPVTGESEFQDVLGMIAFFFPSEAF